MVVSSDGMSISVEGWVALFGYQDQNVLLVRRNGGISLLVRLLCLNNAQLPARGRRLAMLSKAKSLDPLPVDEKVALA